MSKVLESSALGAPWLIVVFGAAVRADGTPSPTLARRIAYAAAAARADPNAFIFCSGGRGTVGPSEASVIASALATICPGRRTILDEESCDTVESVAAASRFARHNRLAGCVACTDGYHQPRVRMLFSVLGIASRSGPVQGGLGGTRLRYWMRMRLREALALPVDLLVVVVRRRRLMLDPAGD